MGHSKPTSSPPVFGIMHRLAVQTVVGCIREILHRNQNTWLPLLYNSSIEDVMIMRITKDICISVYTDLIIYNIHMVTNQYHSHFYETTRLSHRLPSYVWCMLMPEQEGREEWSLWVIPVPLNPRNNFGLNCELKLSMGARALESWSSDGEFNIMQYLLHIHDCIAFYLAPFPSPHTLHPESRFAELYIPGD